MREPHCEDVAELLLFFAPKEILNAIPLTEKNKDKFIDEFDSKNSTVFGNYYKDDIIIWALYYAAKYKGEHSKDIRRILEQIVISTDTIFNLISFVEFEEKLKFGDDKINRTYELINAYRSGPRKKTIETKNKWEIAKQYFIEEKSKHKTLKAARKAAAERAGIFVEERRLFKMLPNPK